MLSSPQAYERENTSRTLVLKPCRYRSAVDFFALIIVVMELQFLGHINRHKGLDHLAVKENIEGLRSRGRRRLTFIESLIAWALGNGKNNNLNRLTENELERRNMNANVCSLQDTEHKPVLSL
ncbi:hypothetical protein PoB_003015700 [Plakobranchus ocellatus]|uniref:Uncharacterized protein n=1 Tax=Plakobranchus ocellatus TaxID=259542 RepID=A0AAV4A8S8_9GAST|nr:hypothetical protein PoB_003015700 [Plakobranchus ocellatus]